MPSYPAIARRSPRARTAHENTKSRLSHRKIIVPLSERLRVILVATHPPLFVVRHTHDIPFAFREKRTWIAIHVLPLLDQNQGRRGLTYPIKLNLPSPLPAVVAPPSPSCGDARLPNSTDRASSQDESHAKSTHHPCVYTAPKETHRLPESVASITAHFKHISIIAIRLYGSARSHRRSFIAPERHVIVPMIQLRRASSRYIKSLISSIISAGKLCFIVFVRFSRCFMNVNTQWFNEREIEL